MNWGFTVTHKAIYLQEQINHWPVATVADGLYGDALLSTLFLLPFKDVLIEVML